jgi:3-oxoacyl-[acyl-carrier-protein] synthase-1
MLRHGFIAGSANIETPDPAAEGMPLVRQTRDAPLRTALSNSFGFGGTNACLVLGRWDETGSTPPGADASQAGSAAARGW